MDNRKNAGDSSSATPFVCCNPALGSQACRTGISCRKQALACLLDMHDLPWTWETPEAVLKARLRDFDAELHREVFPGRPPRDA